MPVDVCDFVAGWIGGAAGVVSSHPLDTVKVRLQTCNTYKGTVDCCMKIMQKEGAKGFFKGMSFPLLSVAAYNALVFGVYSNTTKLLCKWRYNDANHNPGYIDMTVAAMITGGVSVAIGAPVDLVKIRLQAQTGSNNAPLTSNYRQTKKLRNPIGLLRPGTLQTSLPQTSLSSKLVRSSYTTAYVQQVAQPERYRGVIDCLIKIYNENGIRGFYRGGGPAMMIRDIPGYVMYFLPYAALCKLFQNRHEERTGPLGLIFAGGLAGVWSWGVMHPVDTVKSRIQLGGGRYRGVIDCVKTMYHVDGPSVFFRGLTANALRGFPQSAALFFGYEMSMRVMKG